MTPGDYHEAVWAAVPEDAVAAGLARRRTFLLARVNPGERVLDLGCATAELTDALGRAGTRVVGADVSAEALRRARHRHPDLDLRLIAADQELPLPDASFDVVWAGEVIEHVLDTAGWLSEVRRVLVPGGRLLLSTPALSRVALVAMALSPAGPGGHFDPRGDHVRFYTRASLRELLDDLGFEAVTIRGVGGLPGARATLLAGARRGRW